MHVIREYSQEEIHKGCEIPLEMEANMLIGKEMIVTYCLIHSS